MIINILSRSYDVFKSLGRWRSNCASNVEFVSGKEENILEKGEQAADQHFFCSDNVFLNVIIRVVKCILCIFES